MEVRIICDHTTMEELTKLLDAQGMEYGEPREIAGGTGPLNSPFDPEMLKELVYAVTVTVVALNGLLGVLDKTMDRTIKLKKKIRVLLSKNSKPISIGNKEDLKLIEKAMSDSTENESARKIEK